MVNSGLRHIEKEKDHRILKSGPDSLYDPIFMEKLRNDMLATYRSAFQHYIESSTLYKPFLRCVQVEYDASIAALENKVRNFSTHEIDKRIEQDKHVSALADQDISYSKIIEEKVRMMSDLQKKLKAKDNEILNLRNEAENLKISKIQAEDEWQEMRASTSTLTKSLLRYESSNKELKRKESDLINENVKLTISEKKLTSESELLRQKNEELTQENRLLVSYDEIEKKTMMLEQTQLALRYRDDQYKELMQRYSLMKSAIENTYKIQKKLYDNNKISGGGFGVISAASTTGNTDHTNIVGGCKYPATTIELIERNGGDIRAAVEILLDLVRQLQTKKIMGKDTNTIDDLIHKEGESDMGLTDIDNDWGDLDGDDKKEVQEPLDETADDCWPVAGDVSTVSTAIDPTETGPNAGHLPTDTESSSMTANAYQQLMRSAPKGSLFAHFDGLGDDMNIPSYLRMTGRIQNLFFSRRDTGRFINAVMLSARARRELLHRKLKQVSQAGYVPKSAHDYDVGKIYTLLSQPFSVFFETFLRKRFYTDARTVQIAFNLLETSKKYITESDCRLFLLILNDDIPEDVWYWQDDTFKNILKIMEKKEASSSLNTEGKRKLLIVDFLRILRAQFPHKGDSAFMKIQRALALENKSSRFIVDIESLLLERKDEAPTVGGTGLRGMVCELLRSQYITETIQFYEKVMESIDTVCKVPKTGLNIIAYNHQKNASISNQNDTNIETTVAVLRRALILADDNFTRAEVNGYLARGLGVAPDIALLLEAKQEPIVVSDFKTRLRLGLLKRGVPK